MGLEAKFTKGDIHKYLNQQKLQLAEAIISRLELVGWEFVKMAREKTAKSGGFNDVTGNLRSSIGFIVLHNGKSIRENFEPSKNGSDRTTGVREAKQFARQLKGKFPTGYALIVVAGMDYAGVVESRGKDVITGSSLVAEEILKRALDRLKSRV